MSRLGLGTAPIGGFPTDMSDKQAGQTIIRATEQGMRLFDTAPSYGLGLAERRLGEALRALPRSTLTISTKVGRLLRDASSDGGRASLHAVKQRSASSQFGSTRTVRDYSYDGAMRSMEASLQRLQTDRLDIVYVHDPEEHMDEAIHGATRALIKLRDEGVIGAVGVGLDHSWIGLRFVGETDVDCLLVAGRCTLLDRTGTHELFPLCEKRGISVIAASVFNSGLLADPVNNRMFRYKPADAAVLAQARLLSEICSRHGIPLKSAALQFPYRYSVVVAVLVGARSPEEVDDAVTMLSSTIPESLWEELEAAWALLPQRE
jgi:D-threo-aldose 1-dehydrogenase